MALKTFIIQNSVKVFDWLFPSENLELCNRRKGSLESVLESLKLAIDPSLIIYITT